MQALGAALDALGPGAWAGIGALGGLLALLLLVAILRLLGGGACSGDARAVHCGWRRSPPRENAAGRRRSG